VYFPKKEKNENNGTGVTKKAGAFDTKLSASDVPEEDTYWGMPGTDSKKKKQESEAKSKINKFEDEDKPSEKEPEKKSGTIGLNA
jgi:hypothetical protein